MKKTLLAFAAAAVSLTAQAQLVRFKSVNYYVGDEVKAEVITGTAFTVGNDIKKRSDLMSTGGNNVSLGTIPSPGFYRLQFRFSPTLTETYFILAGNKADDITNSSAKRMNATVSEASTVSEVFAKLTEKYRDLDWKKIARESAVEYLKTQALSGTISLTVCLSSGYVPAFVPVCIGNAKTEFRALTIIVIKRMAEEMLAKKFITDEQKKNFIKAVDALNNTLDFFSAKGKLDKLLTAGAIAADYSTQNEAMKLLIQQQKQLYDQTKILIEFSKKNP